SKMARFLFALLLAAVLAIISCDGQGSFVDDPAAVPKKKRKRKKQKFKLEIPRVTVEELANNDTLKSGLHAYVLHGFAKEKWTAMNWTLDYLKEKIPFEWVDYYPNNMRDVGSKPFLHNFEKLVPDFKKPHHTPRYMQIRLGRRGWERLKKDFNPKPLPDVFWDDDEWIKQCMVKEDGKADKQAIDNFFVTQQWKFLLIGEKGTSMFFHKDGTAASSWQVQLVGRKRWTLCPNTETPLLDVNLDTYDPDYKRFPKFARALCGQVTVSPGELLYYPGYWWHHTLQLDTPAVSYTGAMVGVEAPRTDLTGNHRFSHSQFYEDLQEKCAKCWTKGAEARHCDDNSIRWPGAAPPPLRRVCDEYLPKCLKMWEDHADSLHGPKKGSHVAEL
ncbi:unnamed protein product, partial [Polarella glacialis]